MLKRSIIIASTCVMTLLFAVSVQSGWWPFSDEDENTQEGPVTEIFWDDLIPDDFVQPENPFYTMSQEDIDKLLDGSEESNAELARLEQAFNYAPVVTEYDGQLVKIPAYITPLEFDGQTEMKEFLLVPYVGACMHTPPPPANQIVFAQSPKLIKLQSIYDPVWAIGTLKVETVQSALAETGYRLEVNEILPYTTE
ncbi:MAG: DUF3299 domain-containing protein [Granulosicoccus sp.]